MEDAWLSCMHNFTRSKFCYLNNLFWFLELPPDSEEESDEELPSSQEPSPPKNTSHWRPNVAASESSQPFNWPRNTAPAGEMSEASLSSISSNIYGTYGMYPRPTVCNCHQKKVRDMPHHPSATITHNHDSSGSDPQAPLSGAHIPEQSSTLPSSIQQMHQMQHQATCDATSHQTSGLVPSAQTGFSGAKNCTATKSGLSDKSVYDCEEQNAQEAWGQPFMETAFRQRDSLSSRREDGCGESLQVQEPSSVLGVEKFKGRKRNRSPSGGTSGVRQPKSTKSASKLKKMWIIIPG